MTTMKDMDGSASGVAALSIVESLLLALGDLKLMDESEVLGVISDAAEAHRVVSDSPSDRKLHRDVVIILDRIIAGGNSVRRR